LSVNIKSTGRITLLIACALSFLMILSTLPLSLQAYTDDQVYYNAGSDMRIPFPYGSNLSLIQEMEAQMESIQGLETTIVTKGTWHFSTSDESYSVELLGIEEDFSTVAHWKTSYDDQSLQNLVSALYASTAPYPIIIDSISARQENLGLKDIYFPSSEDSEAVTFTIEGITSYWPGFIQRWSINDRYIITQRPDLMDLSLNVPTTVSSASNFHVGIWCRIASLTEIDSVVTQVKTVLQQHGFGSNLIIITQDQMNVDPNILTENFIWIITNFNFITALAAILLIIVLFTLTRITNYATEIGLSRALGMKYRQVFLLMFIEPIIIFSLSGIPGGLAGFLILFGFFNFFAAGFMSGPPFVLDINLPTLIFIYGSVLFVSITTGLISSYMATRANISHILQVE
ncbi:ABC transporter permease, partial [bacterium]|nr:ABC transporter permease [bacterium]